MKRMLRRRYFPAAIAGLTMLCHGGAPAAAQTTDGGPANIIYDSSVDQLVGIYSNPAIANSSDYATGSPSKSIAKTAVIVIFSGAGWGDPNQWADLVQPDNSYIATLFNSSSYFSELPQYGYSSVVYVGGILDTSAQSVSGSFTDAQIQTMVNRYLTYKIPVPSGYTPLYLVLVTPNSGNKTVGGAGEHFEYKAPNGSTVLAAWARIPVAIPHEIVESIVGPAGNNYRLERGFPGGETEIADAGQQGPDDCMTGAPNGTDYPVQPYWSQANRACVIPVGTPHHAAGPTLTSYFDGLSTHVFYVGTDSHVHELIGTGNPATWTTDDPTAVTGAPVVRGGAGLTSMWDPSLPAGSVFYTDANCNVDQLYRFQGQGWNYTSLESQSAGSLPAGTSPPTATPEIEGGRGIAAFRDYVDGSFHVFFPYGVSGLSEFKWTSGTGWTTDSVSGTRAWNTQLSGLFNGTDHVFYIDTSNHIRESYWTGTAWQSTDWSAAVGSNAAALPGNDAIATSTEYAGPNNSSSLTDAQVYYIDTNHQVQTITRYSDGTYSFINLSAGTPSASLAGSPALSCTDIGGLVRLYYIGQDTKVHEIVRTQINTFYDTQTWQVMDTPPAPTGRPYALPSRLLTSCYDPYYDVAYYFDLSETLTTESADSAPIGAGANPGYGWSPSTWTPFLASSLANGPVAFP